MTLEQALKQMKRPDEASKKRCQERWNSIAKPLYSLGIMEEVLIKIAGLTGNSDIVLEKKALVVMCADNGVVAEGVTQAGQEVTAIVSENFLKKQTTASILCEVAGVDLFPVDIGIAADTNIINKKIAYGSQNIAQGPAMTRAEALRAIETGINLVAELKEKGYHIIATGEMGIGNTTTSSAAAAVLLQTPAAAVTGRGAGLTLTGLQRKVEVIERAISVNQPDGKDGIDVLAKVGGFDLAGLAGVFLGGAALGIPILIDGFISATAALAAAVICPPAREAMLATHISKEAGAALVLDRLGLRAPLHGNMCLGEGTGAVTFFPILDMAVAVYHNMRTFQDIQVEAYQPLV